MQADTKAEATADVPAVFPNSKAEWDTDRNDNLAGEQEASPSRHATHPIATVDAVVMTVVDGRLGLLVQRRPAEPYKSIFALAGGYIHPQEDRDAEAAIRRILRDKTGSMGFHLEQLATYSGPVRDPRGWSLSVSYLALVPHEALDHINGDDLKIVDVDTLPALAFDHEFIVRDALQRLRNKGAWSTLPARLLGEEFTLADLLSIYEVVLGKPIDMSSFRRKIFELGIISETGKTSQAGSRRPAKLYRLSGSNLTFDRLLGARD